MPKSLEKTRKKIAKKRNGTVEALHQYSRDSRRLHRASLRDEKLGKQAVSRSFKEEPLLERASFFQEAINEKGSVPLDIKGVHELIHSYVHQYDEELNDLKKTRRTGRPPSTKQDLLETKINALKEEERHGFFVPDLTTESNVMALSRWEGSWGSLNNISWVRVAADSTVKASSFPPT